MRWKIQEFKRYAIILQSGQTALMMASNGGHVECVQLLLDKGAQVDHQDRVSAVFPPPP